MNVMKRVLSLLLSMALLVSYVPAVAFAEETEIPAETEIVAAEETLAPTEAATEPISEETAAPTEAATEPTTEETAAPTEAATEPAEETVPATEEAAQETESDDELPEMVWQTIVPDVDLPENEELHTAYIEQMLYGNRVSVLGIAAGERLSGDAKVLYDALVPYMKEIASGARASTAVAVGQTVTDSSGYTYIPDVEAVFTETDVTEEAVCQTVTNVLEALLSDLPFEMYWYDKLAGCSYGYMYSDTLLYVQFAFPVADNYMAAANTVNTAKTSAAAEAVRSAENIVSKYAASSDYEKLIGYRDEICKLVSYNHDAANAGNYSENDDPWQLVYVFDGDTDTNVVCEGYSKAFMYLCDLTDFAGNVSCYTVSGEMDGGGHMWNIVTLEGSNYMVDVTNSDSGTIGQNGGLFLVGGTGSAAGGYTFLNTSYIYDDGTKSLWGTGADSILTLAAQDYEPNAGGEPDVDENIIASGTCGENLTWKLDDEGTLTISGTGEMENFEIVTGPSFDVPFIIATPWADYKDSIEKVIIADGVTSIGNYAFLSYSELTRVELPASLTDIGDSVFNGCDKLGGIWVDTANSTYCNDASGVLYTKNMDRLLKAPAILKGSYEIPDSVTSIDDYAFSSCKGLTSIDLSGNLTDIGDCVFQSCSGLTSIEVPDGVTSIGTTAFLDCSSLTSIQLPDSVKSLGDGAFIGCSGLTSIEVPDGVTSIGNETFNGCSGLTSIEIPNSVTGIGEWAFVDCSGLTSIEIPDSVTYIGERAFERCSSLTSVTIGDGVTSIGGYAFIDCNLTSVTLGDQVTSIGEAAFWSNSGLTSIVFPNSLTSIGGYAFESCTGLTSITIPGSLTSIGEYAFGYCRNLTEIIFEGSAFDIDGTAFQNVCAKVYYPADDPSWTEDRRVDYDGILTWVPKCKNHSVIIQPAVAPTCTTDGLTEGSYCEYCGEVFAAQQTVPTQGHTEMIIPAVPATCTGSGMTEGVYCIICGETVTAQRVVNPLGHDMGDWIIITEAACGTDGSKTRGCRREGCDYTEDEVIAGPGHKMVDGECTNCGYVEILDSGTCGENLTWTLDGKYTLTISGTGEMTNYGAYQNNAPWFNHNERVASIVIEDGVTTIGDQAFRIFLNLTSVEIPDSVTSIGAGAFYNCTGLTSIEIPDSVTSIGAEAFHFCTGLTNIAIPAGVTSVPDRAFRKCSSLTSITFPDSVTSICDFVFYECTGLKEITFMGDAPEIGINVFYDVIATAYYPANNPTWTADVMQNYGGTITWTPVGGEDENVVASGTCGENLTWVLDKEGTLTISGTGAMENYLLNAHAPWYDHSESIKTAVLENGITSIGDYAFNSLKDMTSITIATTVTSIGSSAFRLCENLKSATLPNGLISIGNGAFFACDRLVGLVIPDSVTSIGASAFRGCESLTSIVVPDGITTIEQYAFADCYSLKRIVIPESVTTIKDSAFFYSRSLKSIPLPDSVTSIGDNAFHDCYSLESMVIPNGVTSIENYTFEGCYALKNVVIPDSVTSIGSSAFKSCHSLTSIQIPDSVTSIGGSAFKSCKNLVSIEIPNGITSIESRTFEDCLSLMSITIPDSVTELNAYAFRNCTSLTEIEIPENVTKIYWEVFASCTSLKNIVIPAAVTRIDREAFAMCTALNAIHFNGNAPTLGDDVYLDVVANAYYPAGNPTWTADKLQNYGGTITWVPYCVSHIEVIYKPVAPTCTETGLTEGKHCSVCGEVLATQEVIPALGHDMGDWSITIPATCTEIGEKSRNCSRCDHFETEEVAASGHSYDPVVTAPTYTKDGYTTYTCILCGDSYVDDYVDALGLPKPVVIAAGNPVTGGGILSWEHDGEADYYKVYRATSKSGKYKLLETVEGTELEVKVGAGKTYYYKVKAICEADSDLNSSYSSVVKVTGKCAQPEINVTAKPSSGKPVVKWSKVSSAKKYDVYRATEIDGTYKKVKTTTSTSYTDSKAKLGVTYYYKVKAIASKSTYNSAYSEVESCLTILAQPDAELSINKTTGKPVIEWEKVSGAISYEILRAESEEGEYTKLANQTELTYTDSAAEPDKDYWYKINAIAENPALNSIDGDAEMIHATLAKPVVSFGVNSISGKPVLTWEEVDGAVEYKIYRSSKSKTSYKCIETTTDLSYSDDSVKAGKGYYYKVIAIGENCKSAYSSYKKLTAVCAQPEITAIGADPVSGKPYVDWEKVSGAEKYYVYRATEIDGEYEKVKSTTKTAYTDSKAKLGVTYYYKVKAVASKSTYNSIYSEVESCLTVLARPVVTAKNDADTGKVILSWEKVDGAVAYEVYRMGEDGILCPMRTQWELAFTDEGEGTEVDTVYTYTVKAIAEDTELNSAESAAVITSAACEKPKVSIKLSSKKPSISWDGVEGATKYYVYRSTKKSSGYKKVATVDLEDGTSYRDSKAKKGTTYYYKIVAVSENAKSAYSNVVKIKSK